MLITFAKLLSHFSWSELTVVSKSKFQFVIENYYRIREINENEQKKRSGIISNKSQCCVMWFHLDRYIVCRVWLVPDLERRHKAAFLPSVTPLKCSLSRSVNRTNRMPNILITQKYAHIYLLENGTFLISWNCVFYFSWVFFFFWVEATIFDDV